MLETRKWLVIDFKEGDCVSLSQGNRTPADISLLSRGRNYAFVLFDLLFSRATVALLFLRQCWLASVRAFLFKNTTRQNARLKNHLMRVLHFLYIRLLLSVFFSFGKLKGLLKVVLILLQPFSCRTPVECKLCHLSCPPETDALPWKPLVSGWLTSEPVL